MKMRVPNHYSELGFIFSLCEVGGFQIVIIKVLSDDFL